MREITIIWTFVLVVVISSCWKNNGESNNPEQVKTTFQVDTSIIAVFPLEMYSIFKNGKSTGLTANDFLTIEMILNKCTIEHHLDLKQYKRQYIAIINSKGEKEVWVNCLCGGQDWKTKLIVGDDGGDCYFNLKINLGTKLCYDFLVNSEG